MDYFVIGEVLGYAIIIGVPAYLIYRYYKKHWGKKSSGEGLLASFNEVRKQNG